MSNRTATLVWGEQGLLAAGKHSVCVIVDVLSFSTSVDAACTAGALVYPYPWKDETAQTFATSVAAELAVQRQDGAEGLPSLSPPSLTKLAHGTRLVLPSPNGSTLSTRANAATVLCSCLRNASAAAQFINGETSGDIVVVAAGERWPDGSLRPALEDLLGAGAVLTELSCTLDVEAEAARTLYLETRENLPTTIEQTMSGQELISRGFGKDVTFATQSNASQCIALLADGAYRNTA